MTTTPAIIDTITAAFEQARPSVREDVEGTLRAIVGRAFDHHGETLRGMSGCWSGCGRQASTVYRLTESTDPTSHRHGGAQQINEAALAQWTEETVAAILTSFVAKITAKTEGMDTLEVKWLAGSNFTLVGTKAGHRVVINQRIILNVSNRGTLFNQFPARITVDGKASSEKALKAL